MSEMSSGVLQCLRQGSGFLRDPDRSYQPGSKDPYVPAKLIRQYGLVDGADIKGTVQQNQKGIQLTSLESVCGLSPDKFQERSRFDRLLAINPNERIKLGNSGNISMRMIELIAPIGWGTRGLIVSSPKSGKTQLLEEMANAISQTEPNTRIIVLLIDERPEEVTHFRRNVSAEVLASSSDQSIESHVNLAEFAMNHIRVQLECGCNIVVLVDSITRLARAFNLHGSGSNRTMSGGLDARALDIPRRFFGLARNIEDGGSVTVIATAQVDTGSRMDGFIFEEFKSTGNSEIVLDRTLAEARLFPAINVLASGTRREELLYSDEEIKALTGLRRFLVNNEPKAALSALLKVLKSTPTNKELLQQFLLPSKT